MEKRESFTLIELLIVVSLIALLTSIFLSHFSSVKERAKIKRTEMELDQIKKAIITAQYREDKVLLQITGSNCSDCACRTGEDLSKIPDTHQCIINWKNAFNKIGIVPVKDSWGSPYLIDENELEGGGCTKDSLRSAGPDRIWGGSDDILIYIPLYSSLCAE